MAEKNELTVVESKKKVVGAQENEHYVKFSKPYGNGKSWKMRKTHCRM